jgi:hypothetical protein
MLLADEKYSALLVSPVDFTPTKKTALPSVTELEHLEVKILAFTARTFSTSPLSVRPRCRSVPDDVTGMFA